MNLLYRVWAESKTLYDLLGEQRMEELVNYLEMGLCKHGSL